MAPKNLLILEEWFSKRVLYERYKLILLWSLLAQSALILCWTTLSAFFNSPLTSLPWNISLSVSSSHLLLVQIILASVLMSLMFFHFRNLSMVPKICISHYETASLWSSLDRLTQICSFTIAAVIYWICLGWNYHSEFVKSWCLNDQQIFSILLAVCSGIYICVNYFVKHDYCPKFETVRQLKLPLAKYKFKENLLATFLEVNKYFTCFLVSFVLFSFAVKLTINTIKGGIVCDTGITPLATFFNILDIKLLSINYSIAFLFKMSWSFTLSLSQMFLTEEYEFSFDSVNENRPDTLIKAITVDKCPLIQYLAYQHFKNLVNRSPSCRLQLFAISLPGGHPYNWNSLTDDSLKMLNQLLSAFNPKEASNKMTEFEKKSPTHLRLTEALPQSPVITQQNNNHYASPQETPGLRNIAGLYKTQSPFSKNISPELNVENNAKTATQLIMNSKNLLKSVLPQTLVKVFTQEINERKQELLYLSCQPSIWAIEALTSAIVASYTEDKYGVVQWSLPSILRVFLDLQNALERPQHKLAPRKGCKDKSHVARQFQHNIKATIKCSLYRIVCTFWQHLNVKDYTEEQWQRLLRFKQFYE